MPEKISRDGSFTSTSPEITQTIKEVAEAAARILEGEDPEKVFEPIQEGNQEKQNSERAQNPKEPKLN